MPRSHGCMTVELGYPRLLYMELDNTLSSSLGSHGTIPLHFYTHARTTPRQRDDYATNKTCATIMAAIRKSWNNPRAGEVCARVTESGEETPETGETARLDCACQRVREPPKTPVRNIKQERRPEHAGLLTVNHSCTQRQSRRQNL